MTIRRVFLKTMVLAAVVLAASITFGEPAAKQSSQAGAVTQLAAPLGNPPQAPADNGTVVLADLVPANIEFPN